jgi:hypothetical protein
MVINSFIYVVLLEFNTDSNGTVDIVIEGKVEEDSMLDNAPAITISS